VSDQHHIERRSAAGAYWLPRPACPAPSRILRDLSAVRGLLTGDSARSPTVYPQIAEGAPVLLVPGFLAGDRSLQTLARHLAEAGFRPQAAGIARNVDCSEASAARLAARLERVASEHGQQVAIVGHSRGGMLARVLARRRPELVSGVIALAAPHRHPLALHPLLLAHAFSLGALGSIGVPGLVRYSCALGRCCSEFRRDHAAPVNADLGYVSIYSRRDGIVDWRACLDPSGRHVEVTSSHTGMATDHATLHVVIRALERFRSP
jgi:triacylglycerol lipase